MVEDHMARAEMLADVRSRLFSRYPYLKGNHQAKLGKRITDRWDLFDTMSFEELPPLVQRYIKNEPGTVIVDDFDNPLITIYPDQRPSTQNGRPQLKDPKEVAFARKGAFAKIAPVIAELKLINGLVRYQRMGRKRCINQRDPHKLGQFRREQAMASHILGLFDQEKEPQPIAKPLVIGKEEILYEWWTDNEGRTHNLEDSTLTAGEYLQCLADAADALTTFHRHQIKYLDLSESNIAIGHGKRAKLIDLGAARLYDDIVDADTSFHEHYYEWRIVIQQEKFRPALDIADKYALGVLVRSCLQRYKLASIQTTPRGRRLVMAPDFLELAPLLEFSDQLRAGLFHPNAYFDDNPKAPDPEYCDLKTTSASLRTLANIVDRVVDTRGRLLEIVPKRLQKNDR
jgi:hypothetical protein